MARSRLRRLRTRRGDRHHDRGRPVRVGRDRRPSPVQGHQRPGARLPPADRGTSAHPVEEKAHDRPRLLAARTPRPASCWAPAPARSIPRVLAALGMPLLGHLDPEFVAIMDQTQGLLRQVFKTENRLTMAVSGTGSAGMEAVVVNLIEPGDKMLVCVNGVFGGRMVDVAGRAGRQGHGDRAPLRRGLRPAGGPRRRPARSARRSSASSTPRPPPAPGSRSPRSPRSSTRPAPCWPSTP